MRRLLPLLLLVAGGACRSSAPYTVPSAAINAAIAVGASAAQRAGGGCYATCTGGTACNPVTGYCEPATTFRCEGDASSSLCEPGPSLGASRTVPPATSPGFVPALGVSPATGSVPPPPSQASPGSP
jgi:hypothetical protein